MKKHLLPIISAAFLAITALPAEEKIKVLIVDGPQGSHDYQKTTPVLKEILEKIPHFEVGLSRSSPEACEDGSYKPDFGNPLFPASGLATGSFNGLHPKSKFLATG